MLSAKFIEVSLRFLEETEIVLCSNVDACRWPKTCILIPFFDLDVFFKSSIGTKKYKVHTS